MSIKRTNTPFDKILADYYTIQQAAVYLGKNPSQVWRYCRDGLLKKKMLHMQSFILKSDVHNFTPPPPGNPAFRK